MEVFAGCAMADITPSAGLAMAGFGARDCLASGAHDPLTVRALAIGDTALLVVDVIGVDAATSARIAERAGFTSGQLVVTAVHNHGGPATMPGRLGGGVDPAYYARFEDACIDVLNDARRLRAPARLAFGIGTDPGVSFNRRHQDGPVDRGVPILTVERTDGRIIAALVSHACHPVVLGADNQKWTADYPHFVRETVETAIPGAVCLFVTGCAGDVNSGHAARASVSVEPQPDRSFAVAERIGQAVGEAALAAVREPVRSGTVCGESRSVALRLARREIDPPSVLVKRWESEAERAEGPSRRLLSAWAQWARTNHAVCLDAVYPAQVSLLRWGSVMLGALPGEIFAQTALELRAAFRKSLVLAAYANDNPGYFPPACEYVHGGYEVDEAHRFYGMPGTFAPGSAERLRDALIELAND